MKDIVRQIKERRKALKVYGTVLSKHIGRHEAFISMVERGETSPKVKDLINIAGALNMYIVIDSPQNTQLDLLLKQKELQKVRSRNMSIARRKNLKHLQKYKKIGE